MAKRVNQVSPVGMEDIPAGSDTSTPSHIVPPSAKLKLDEYFREWLSLPDTQDSIFSLLDDAKTGRPLSWKHPYVNPLSGSGKIPMKNLISPPPRSPNARGQFIIHSPLNSPTGSPMRQRPQTNSFPKRRSSKRHFRDAAPPRKPADSKITSRRRENVPLFYFPNGPPQPISKQEAEESKIKSFFNSIKGKSATADNFGELVSIIGLQSFLSRPLFSHISRGNSVLSMDQFLRWWEDYIRKCDPVVRFFNVIRRPPNDYITAEDFRPFIDALMEEHSALEFLRATPEFQERYAETVIVRFFYKVNRSLTGRITLRELRASNLAEVFAQVENETDINVVTEYFSYEHFYVLYCRFWELDTDHDMTIDTNDLLRYSGHSLTFRIVERVFQNGGKKLTGPKGKMSYHDFIWFCLSEEDKNTDTALEYWFRCIDFDGDGFISVFEMEWFYDEQLRRMESLGIEAVGFEDVLCQLMDMMKPKVPGRISLKDLKASGLGGNFFNILFNLTKFIAQESRDAAAIRNERMRTGMTEWDRFARIEYDLLAAEEEAAGGDDGLGVDDDVELDDVEEFDTDHDFSNVNDDLFFRKELV